MDNFLDDSGNAAPLRPFFAFNTEGEKPVVISTWELSCFLACATGYRENALTAVADVIAVLPKKTQKEYSASINPLGLVDHHHSILARLVRRDNIMLSFDDHGRLGLFRWQGMPERLSESVNWAHHKTPQFM